MRGDCGPKLPLGCYPRHVDSDASARASVTACRRSCASAYLCSPRRHPGRFSSAARQQRLRISSLTASEMSGRKNANGHFADCADFADLLIADFAYLLIDYLRSLGLVDKPSRSPLIFAPSALDLRLGTVAGQTRG